MGMLIFAIGLFILIGGVPMIELGTVVNGHR
jgi:hypothetical protein